MEAQPRDVPPRLRQAGDDPLTNRIVNKRKDDGDRPGGVLYRPDRLHAVGQDDIHLEADELCRQRGKSLNLPVRKAVLQGDTLALHIAEVAEPLAEGFEAGVWVKGLG